MTISRTGLEVIIAIQIRSSIFPKILLVLICDQTHHDKKTIETDQMGSLVLIYYGGAIYSKRKLLLKSFRKCPVARRRSVAQK